MPFPIGTIDWNNRNLPITIHRMNWQKIIFDLKQAYGSEEKLAQLALCPVRTIQSIERGRIEPAYQLGDRLIRMHDQLMEMKPRFKK